MQKKTLFFVVAIVCLVAIGYGFYLYQKPRSGVEGATAAYTVPAVNLYQAFISDETAATKKYVDEVVEVNGVVKQVDSLQGKVNVVLAADAAEGGVNCSLTSVGSLPKVGAAVTVKGRCAGFLMDVNLVDAVLVQH